VEEKTMHTTTKIVSAAALAAALAIGGAALARPGNGNGRGPGDPGGGAVGRPGSARADLVLAVASPDADAAGRIEVRRFAANRGRAAREWMVVKVRRADAGAALSLWMDDPSTTDDDATLTQVATTGFTAGARGGAQVRFDTKHGALPFSSTLANLAGKSLEVRGAAGDPLLAAVVPEIR
jgi:hypothetical protein